MLGDRSLLGLRSTRVSQIRQTIKNVFYDTSKKNLYVTFCNFQDAFWDNNNIIPSSFSFPSSH